MRKLFWLILLLAFFLPPAKAAGGTCPTGAMYLNPANQFGSLVTLSSLGVTSCYFISASGSDLANGTTESTPWLHAPGMASCSSTCAGVTPAAGEGFIFHGGDTWHFGNSSASPYVGAFQAGCEGSETCSWQPAQSGSSGSPIYWGVDTGWPASGWTRPIMNGDNATSSTGVSSCTYDFSTNKMMSVHSRFYNIIDDFEWTGFCWQAHSPNGSIISLNQGGTTPSHNVVMRNYIHGWTHEYFGCIAWQANHVYSLNTTIKDPNGNIQQVTTAGTSGGSTPTFATTLGATTTDGGVTWTLEKVGSDSTCGGVNAINGPSNNTYAYGDQILQLVIDGSDTDQVSMDGITFGAYEIGGSVLRYLANAETTNNTHSMHDTLFEFIAQAGDGVSHTNVYEFNTEAIGVGGNVIYNNVIRSSFVATGSGQIQQLATNKGETDYYFGNILYAINSNGNYFNTCGGNGAGSGCGFTDWTLNAFNNTFVMPASGTDNTVYPGSIMNYVNNHCVNPSTACLAASSLGADTQSGTSYTIPSSDYSNEDMVVLTNAGAVALTGPTFTAGNQGIFVKTGAGGATFTAAGGGTCSYNGGSAGATCSIPANTVVNFFPVNGACCTNITMNSGFLTAGTSGQLTTTTSLVQTPTAADLNTSPNFDQYTASQSFAYSPVASTNSTVAAQASGTNLTTSYCATMLASSDPQIHAAGVACELGGTYACSYNATTHTVSCPATTPAARPSTGSWDNGWAEYPLSGSAAATPTITPSSGTVTLTVTFSSTSGTVICEGTTNPPVTNGSGTGCTTGSPITTNSGTSCVASSTVCGDVSISSSGTYYAVAGSAALADSSVASGTYSAATGPKGKIGTGTKIGTGVSIQ